MVSGLPRAFSTAMVVVLLYYYLGAIKMDALFADFSEIAPAFAITVRTTPSPLAQLDC
jgi:hypothetical protein